jgi:putative endonuclease
MKWNTRTLGNEGEDRACAHLRANGYEIIARNWRSRFGEIDIIARDADTLAFIEVKARSRSGFGGPEAALDRHKRARIVAAARAFLAAHPSDLPVRFDLVALASERLRLYKGAFRVDEAWFREF